MNHRRHGLGKVRVFVFVCLSFALVFMHLCIHACCMFLRVCVDVYCVYQCAYCSNIVQFTFDNGSTELGNWENGDEVGRHVFIEKRMCVIVCSCLCVYALDGSGKEIRVYDRGNKIDIVKGVGLE